MIVVDEQRLTPVAEIGDSSAGTATQVRCTDPRLPVDMAYKALRSDLDPAVGRRLVDQMEKAVGFRGTISAADLAELDSFTIWPLAMVTRADRFTGCLTRIVDRDFFLEVASSGGRLALRIFDLGLFHTPDGRSLVDDDLVRLALMARLAYALEVVHRPRAGRRFVYGDLNLRDVAVATDPPRILLLNCDGLADVGDPTRTQMHTPFFVPPELQKKQQKLQDQVTDVYKLALCVIRSLSTGRGATQLTDPASPLIRPGLLDRAGVDLLDKALGADRDRRPTAEDIKDYLIGRVLELVERPRLRSR